MSLVDNLNEAARYTGKIFQRLGDLLVLFIISIIPIVNFIAIGYYARIVKEGSSSEVPPRLERYGDMFVEGLKIVVVGIIWALIIGVISVIIARPFLALAFFSSFADPLFFTSAWLFTLGPFLAIFGIIAFLLGIIAFMGVIHMVKTGSFGKAFAFGEILNAIGKIGWLRYLAFFAVAFIASAIVSVLSSAFGPFGWVVSAVLSVLEGLFIARTIGLLYDQAMKTTIPPTNPSTTA
ncbi:MAG: DUF4013 domain-containing protein [Candidatus Bathyarchaeota archaeon]|nr:DUF4013 domain-containing protein [Candidatus Bathyarchaeota archaeon]